jgi:Uma2 family endonuclease
MRRMKATDARVSYAELQQWPDDGRHYELHDGEVVVVPSPLPKHQRVALSIADVLREYEQASGGVVLIAPLDIVFTEYDVLQPDIVFFRHERRDLVRDWEETRAAPDLAVEVLSRSTEARDRGRKMEMFARFGVPEYWIVDPAKNTLEIYVLRSGEYELTAVADEHASVTSATLDGLTFPASRTFNR